MLSIHDLHVSIADTEILKGIDLEIGAGEVHAIMGPNGSGKSTLTKTIGGHPAYAITNGHIRYRHEDLADMAVEERATSGIFIGFQYPVEVPGVTNAEFLRLAYNARQRALGKLEMSTNDFAPYLHRCLEAVDMSEDFVLRGVNAGFSGGQKKRNEILQMFVLQPDMVILDETDSGLDIDALRVVAKGINNYRSPTRSILLITHYQRLLELVVPDRVHVLSNGRIVRSGGKELALELEEHGYDGIEA